MPTSGTFSHLQTETCTQAYTYKKILKINKIKPLYSKFHKILKQ